MSFFQIKATIKGSNFFVIQRICLNWLKQIKTSGLLSPASVKLKELVEHYEVI